MSTLTSPTLGFPMVDARCSYHHIGMGADCTTKDAYRLVGSCANCNSQIVGLFTVGHEANSGWNSPECPVCQCKGKLYWKGLEDTYWKGLEDTPAEPTT